MKIPSILTLISVLIFSINYCNAQDCWNPRVPQEKPCHIYFVGTGYGETLEIAKKNADFDVVRQATSYLGVRLTYESESKLEAIKKNSNLSEEETFTELIKTVGDVRISRLAQIDLCEKSFKKNNRIYLLYRLPKGKDCQDKPDYDESKPMKMGITPLLPGLGQWRKKEFFKAGVFPTLFVGGIALSLVFNNQSNVYYNQAQTLYNTNPVYYGQYISYSDQAKSNRDIALISTGVVYLISLIDAKFINVPRIYAFNNLLELKSYMSNSHTGFTLSIALNK